MMVTLGFIAFSLCSHAAARHLFAPHAPAATGLAHRAKIPSHLPPLAVG
jgi:hypothetical protein